MSARVARVARHMTLARASIVVFVLVALLTTVFMIKMTQGEAAPPSSTTDATVVPHYFGPWPNWALSPLTQGNAPVTITGDGTGATATATVGGNGAITAINVTNPGSGYTTATREHRRLRHGRGGDRRHRQRRRGHGHHGRGQRLRTTRRPW